MKENKLPMSVNTESSEDWKTDVIVRGNASRVAQKLKSAPII
jgi:hypothetical protein